MRRRREMIKKTISKRSKAKRQKRGLRGCEVIGTYKNGGAIVGNAFLREGLHKN
jgi:hypothetical protein